MYLEVSPLVYFLSAILGLLGIGTYSLENYRKKYEAIDYGIKVEVDGRNMSVNISGEQYNQTIVFLPGFGSFSPYYDYKTILEPLSYDYKVVTVEPFGSGLSDLTDKERTNDNIVSEVHTCLKKLGITKFYLMAHSLGGIYSLAYVNQYADEVLGFIGLDNTANNYEHMKRNQTIVDDLKNGFGKFLSKHHLWRIAPDGLKDRYYYIDPNYSYTEKELEDYNIIFGYLNNNENVINEDELRDENIKAVEDMVFTCPALMFLANTTSKYLPHWVQDHEAMIGNPENSEIIELDGNHTIYMDQKDYILKKIKEWIK